MLLFRPSICLGEISGDRTNAWLGGSSINRALQHHDGQIAKTVYFGYKKFSEKRREQKWWHEFCKNIGLYACTAHELMALRPDTTARSAPGSFSRVWGSSLSNKMWANSAARQDNFSFFFFLPDSSLNLSSLVSLWLTLFEKLILAAKNLWTRALPFWSHVCSLELKNRRRRGRRRNAAADCCQTCRRTVLFFFFHVEQGHKSGSASVTMWIICQTKSGRRLKSKPQP